MIDNDWFESMRMKKEGTVKEVSHAERNPVTMLTMKQITFYQNKTYLFY